jgi:hypothetical protein
MQSLLNPLANSLQVPLLAASANAAIVQPNLLAPHLQTFYRNNLTAANFAHPMQHFPLHGLNFAHQPQMSLLGKLIFGMKFAILTF